MKSVKFDIQASNAKGNNVTFTIQVTHAMTGTINRFAAEIVGSTKPIVWGHMPTGYYPDGEAISKGEIQKNEIRFGTGEIQRQGTSPFCVYLADSERNKKDRILFQLPVTKYELLKMFK